MGVRKSDKELQEQKRLGNTLLLVGCLLIAAALGLVGFNYWDSERAGRESGAILEELDRKLDGKELQDPTIPAVNAELLDDRVQMGGSWLEQQVMPTVEIDGYRYIGTLEIPSLNIRLPVMENWDLDRLKISPCLYSGSYFTDDMVICGHNYARHFSPIKGVDIGADVYFTTVDAVLYHYTVSNITTLQPTAVNQMIQNQNNSHMSDGALENWDMTLFTCNTGGQTRCAVRCVRADRREMP